MINQVQIIVNSFRYFINLLDVNHDWRLKQPAYSDEYSTTVRTKQEFRVKNKKRGEFMNFSSLNNNNFFEPISNKRKYDEKQVENSFPTFDPFL